MWQKINHWLTQHLLIAPLPIFAKMVLLYSSIVFFILLTVSDVTHSRNRSWPSSSSALF